MSLEDLFPTWFSRIWVGPEEGVGGRMLPPVGPGALPRSATGDQEQSEHRVSRRGARIRSCDQQEQPAVPGAHCFASYRLAR